MANDRLSFEQVVDIDICDLISKPSGERYPFYFNLSKSSVNQVAEPYIMRAVKLCKKALQKKQLGLQDIDRLILAGGPTRMPIFKEMLADTHIGLGIPPEFSVDPMTVVAQGAAIFARTQKMTGKKPVKAVSGELSINIHIPAADADPEPWIGGEIFSVEGLDFSGFTIEFSNPDWRSGAVSVNPDGKFMTQLVAERGENTYSIQVVDNVGNVQKIDPETISYLCLY